jgi:YVTN family beta-propeller protein
MGPTASSAQVTSAPDCAGFFGGKAPDWLAFTPDGGAIYVSNAQEDTISAVDVKRRRKRTRIFVGKGKRPIRSLVVSVPE